MRLPRLVARLLGRAAGPTSRITLVVSRVPVDTPPEDTLSLGANVNEWKPERPDYAFTRRADGAYELALELTTGSVLEYKLTRGSWATVEKAASGADIPNRRWRVRGDATVRISVGCWADKRAHTITGDVEAIEAVESPQLRNARPLWVYLPPSYRNAPERRYPVMYLHDGQNVFDAATSFSGEWCADETAERLARRKGIEAILVAIANTADRMREYTPFPAPENGGTPLANRYADFVVHTVKPMIDARYRTLPERAHTGILGSSLGGLVSLHAALVHPETFGFVGAMSPSFWFAGGRMYGWTREHPAPPMRIYLDVGTAEEGESPAGTAGFVRDTREMGRLLEGQGHQVRVVVARGANHSEAAWSRRFPGALEWFLSP